MSKAQTVPEIHPDVVLEALLAKGGRSQRLGNLQKVHDICRRQHSGSKDFSTSAIGRICEAEGVLKGRALYNAASADYVSLIPRGRQAKTTSRAEAGGRTRAADAD